MSIPARAGFGWGRPRLAPRGQAGGTPGRAPGGSGPARALRRSDRGALAARLAGLLAPALGALAFGCAINKPEPTEPCTRAVDRLETECGFTVDGADAGAELNCSGAAACAADCLYTAPCEDIKKNSPAFTDCLAACKNP